MYKVTYKANFNVNFFKWFKTVEQANTFAQTKDNSVVKFYE